VLNRAWVRATGYRSTDDPAAWPEYRAELQHYVVLFHD
jgi:hypothetical protein